MGSFNKKIVDTFSKYCEYRYLSMSQLKNLTCCWQGSHTGWPHSRHSGTGSLWT